MPSEAYSRGTPTPVASIRCTAASVPNCGPRPWAHRRGTNERASRPSTTRGPTIRTGRKGDRRHCVSPPDDARAEDRRHRAAEIPGDWEPPLSGFVTNRRAGRAETARQGSRVEGTDIPASGPREDRRFGRAYPSITTSEAGIEPSGLGEASERAQPSPGRAPAVLHRARERGPPLSRV